MAHITFTVLNAQADWVELGVAEQKLVSGGTVEVFDSLIKYFGVYPQAGETTVIEYAINTKTQTAVVNNSIEANGIAMVVNFS